MNGDRVLFKDIPGTIRFIGTTDFAPGEWIGVELDEPSGKNDGEVNGVRYFTCPQRSGIFVREPMLEVIPIRVSGGGKSTRALPRMSATRSSRLSDGPSRLSGSKTPSRLSDDRNLLGEGETTRLKSIIQKLESKLQSMHTEMETLNTNITELSSHNTSLAQSIYKAEEQLELVSIDKETLEEHNEMLKKQIMELTAQNERLQNELAAIREEIQLSKDVGSTELVQRNGLLERALIKLRDRTEELEAQLETALIYSQNEIPPELQRQHEETENKLTLVESQLAELESLYKDEQDLSALHMETEMELQKQIESLEVLLNGKQALVTSLQNKNAQLVQLAEQTNSVADSIPTNIPLDIERYQSQLSDSKRENNALRIDLMVLQYEVSSRESLLTGLSSDPCLKTVKSLQKYADIIRSVCGFIKPGEDVYINLLGELMRLKLLSFSILLSHAAEYGRIFELELDPLIDNVVHHVKEEQFRGIDLIEKVTEIQKQLKDSPVNKLELKYSLKLRKLHAQSIVAMTGLVSDQSIKNNVEQIAECAKLYQAALNHVRWAESLLAKLAAEMGDITKCELISIQDVIELAYEEILTQFSSAEHQTGQFSILKQLNELMHVMHPTDLSWKSISNAPKCQEAKIAETVDVKEEYEAKIAVLQSRLSTSKDTELLMRKYKLLYDELSVQHADADAQLQTLISENQVLSEELTKAKNNNLLYNGQFESLIKQKKAVEHTDLVSEIQSLRRAVRHFTSVNNMPMGWLRRDLPVYAVFERREVDDVREMGKALRELVMRKMLH